jgi:hypothetical protein
MKFIIETERRVPQDGDSYADEAWGDVDVALQDYTWDEREVVVHLDVWEEPTPPTRLTDFTFPVWRRPKKGEAFITGDSTITGGVAEDDFEEGDTPFICRAALDFDDRTADEGFRWVLEGL